MIKGATRAARNAAEHDVVAVQGSRGSPSHLTALRTEIGEFEKGAEQGAWGLCAADPANRSEFPPVLTGYATKLGASRPVSKRRLAHRVIDVDSTYRVTLEHCRVFDFEELQMKGQSAINHNFMNGHEVLRFG